MRKIAVRQGLSLTAPFLPNVAGPRSDAPLTGIHRALLGSPLLSAGPRRRSGLGHFGGSKSTYPRLRTTLIRSLVPPRSDLSPACWHRDAATSLVNRRDYTKLVRRFRSLIRVLPARSSCFGGPRKSGKRSYFGTTVRGLRRERVWRKRRIRQR